MTISFRARPEISPNPLGFYPDRLWLWHIAYLSRFLLKLPQQTDLNTNRHQPRSTAVGADWPLTPVETYPISPGAACFCLASVVIDSRSDWLQFKSARCSSMGSSGRPNSASGSVPNLKPLTIT